MLEGLEPVPDAQGTAAAEAYCVCRTDYVISREDVNRKLQWEVEIVFETYLRACAETEVVVAEIPAEVYARSHVPVKSFGDMPSEVECGREVKIGPLVALCPSEVCLQPVFSKRFVPRYRDFARPVWTGAEAETELIVWFVDAVGNGMFISESLPCGVAHLRFGNGCQRKQNDVKNSDFLHVSKIV